MAQDITPRNLHDAEAHVIEESDASLAPRLILFAASAELHDERLLAAEMIDAEGANFASAHEAVRSQASRSQQPG
jgi:hypothetical protein